MRLKALPSPVKRAAGYALCLLCVVLFPASLYTDEFPVFRVVIDPGHGGRMLEDRSRHGDRYDPISRTYLQEFKEGASYGSLEEHALVYAIAEKTQNRLALCSTGGDFEKFHALLRRFTDDEPDRIAIDCSMSRSDSRNRVEIEKREDPNAEYRVFDYPNARGKMQPGRISVINAKQPHLVVSLHAALSGPAYYRGMNPVITAPYSLLYRGLLYLKKAEPSRDFFTKSRYRDWFEESNSRSCFEWFLNDTALYFIAHPLSKRREVSVDDFKGYRYNMISWNYRDGNGWESIAASHPLHTPYSSTPEGFVPMGRYWEREQSKFEVYRREGGYEGFGGDNHYASAEIIRYILWSLRLSNQDHPDQRLGRPYISVWHVPLHVNAVNAFIELGYLNRPWFRHILTSRQDEIADGIAAGIYSLLAGVNPGEKTSRFRPRGKKIDFKKYSVTNARSYFDEAVDE